MISEGYGIIYMCFVLGAGAARYYATIGNTVSY
jgi:hypothetical protein